MTLEKRVLAAIFLGSVALAAGGCAGGGRYDGAMPDEYGNEQPTPEDLAHIPAPAGTPAPLGWDGSATSVAPGWECNYSPTMNNDWHDDVLCTDGTESERPRLREWDSYVTESEIMTSAREYEERLNAQSGYAQTTEQATQTEAFLCDQGNTWACDSTVTGSVDEP